jgi:hypothetical protein
MDPDPSHEATIQRVIVCLRIYSNAIPLHSAYIPLSIHTTLVRTDQFKPAPRHSCVNTTHHDPMT